MLYSNEIFIPTQEQVLFHWPRNHTDIKDSIDQYIARSDSNGVFAEIIRNNTKAGALQDVNKYLLSPDVNSKGRVFLPNDPIPVFVDGTHGFALGCQKKDSGKTLWLAMMGLGFLEEGTNHVTTHIKNNPHQIFPVIRQLQVLTSSANKIEKKEKSEILAELHDLRWERILITNVVNWARKSSFQKIYSIPAEKCRWARKEDLERYKIRYNTSAKRLGFKKDEASGYWVFKTIT